MKPGTRALGIAESYEGTRSTLAGSVVAANGRVDGFSFATCTVGGLDATESIIELWERIDREDIRYCFVSGIAPAWYNLIDLDTLDDAISIPVLVVTFEESEGLTDSIQQAFPPVEAEARLRRYRALPEREQVNLKDSSMFVRTHDHEIDVASLVDAFTVAGSRPEPLRIARLAARAADAWRRRDR